MSKTKKTSHHRKITPGELLPLLSLIDRVIHAHYRWTLPKLPSGIFTLEDLRQEGILGAIRALQLFDPKKGKLSQYAWWHIRAKIGRFIWENSHPNITLPPYVKTPLSFLPIHEPINRNLLRTVEDAISIKNYVRTATEIDHQRSARKLAGLILKKIPSPERRIVQKYFGLCSCRRKTAHYHAPMTAKEIGRERGLSRQRIGQIIDETIQDLRHDKRVKKLGVEWLTA